MPTTECIDHAMAETTQNNNAWLGDKTWIESETGFPPGGYGADPGQRPAPNRPTSGRPAPDEIVAPSQLGPLTGGHIGDLVAFAEFLAGTALNGDERDWFSDAMAQEFVKDPKEALEQLVPVTHAVTVIPGLVPFERANNRLKALTHLYAAEPIRQKAKLPETPVMAMVKAHNPAILSEEAGVIVVADALVARRLINELTLELAGRNLDDLADLRTALLHNHRTASLAMKAELAASQVHLVLLRSWLAELPQSEMDRLRARLTDVMDGSTELDLVTLQLSFRSIVEAAAKDLDSTR